MRIEVVEVVTDELLDAFQHLTPQLTNNNPPPTRDDLAALVSSGCSTLLIARAENETIIGALCLAVYRVPTGIRAIIEDVIVDESVRGQGMGESLVRHGLELAKQAGAAHVTLTSNPGREAANRLYQRMGFARRETNAYIYRF